jgi:hypothetical protein
LKQAFRSGGSHDLWRNGEQADGRHPQGCGGVGTAVLLAAALAFALWFMAGL